MQQLQQQRQQDLCSCRQAVQRALAASRSSGRQQLRRWGRLQCCHIRHSMCPLETQQESALLQAVNSCAGPSPRSGAGGL